MAHGSLFEPDDVVGYNTLDQIMLNIKNLHCIKVETGPLAISIQQYRK